MAAMALKAATTIKIMPLLLKISLLALRSMRINCIKLVLVNIIKAYGIRNSIAIYLQCGYNKKQGSKQSLATIVTYFLKKQICINYYCWYAL
jgi:hypothetical protein